MGNFEEARRNPDKLTGPLSGQKVLFQDQGSSTIARGPETAALGFREDISGVKLLEKPKRRREKEKVCSASS